MIAAADGGHEGICLAPVPAGWRLRADPELRTLEGGAVLLGGMPLRLFRLGPRAARHVAAWSTGTPVADRPRARRLARRLLDAGLFHPDPRAGAGAADAGSLTVVVPVRDRAAELERCLAGLGRRWPVVVVDDCSRDPDAVTRVAEAAGARIVRRERNGGPAAARNAGAAVCMSALVAFVDSDCVPGPGWLDRLTAHFGDPAVGAAAPRIVAWAPGTGDRCLARYESDRSALDMGAREAAARPGGAVPYVPSTALVVRREAFAAGFDEGMRFGEDVDLAWRLVERGWTVRYDPSVTVAHEHRVEPLAWIRTRVAYNTAAGDLDRRHPGALHAARASRWSIVVWAALAAGRPSVALAAASVPAVGLRLRLGRHVSRPGRIAVSLAVRGALSDGDRLACAVRGPWLPLACAAGVRFRPARRVLAAAFLAAPLLEWLDRRPALDPASYAAARGLDDIARGLGVWTGCVRYRTAAPLLLRLARPRPLPAHPGRRAG